MLGRIVLASLSEVLIHWSLSRYAWPGMCRANLKYSDPQNPADCRVDSPVRMKSRRLAHGFQAYKPIHPIVEGLGQRIITSSLLSLTFSAAESWLARGDDVPNPCRSRALFQKRLCEIIFRD